MVSAQFGMAAMGLLPLAFGSLHIAMLRRAFAVLDAARAG